MKKREIFMLSSTVFSLGMVVGFLLSPIKKGIFIYGGDGISSNSSKKHVTNDDDTNIHK